MAVAGFCFLVMWTWRQGQTIVWERLSKNAMSLDDFANMIAERSLARVPGTAVFMSGDESVIPPILLRHVQRNQVLHKQVVLVTVIIEDTPRVWSSDRAQIKDLNHGVFQVLLRFGFMQDPDVPKMLRSMPRQSDSPLDLENLEDVTYFVGDEILMPSVERPGMLLWREKLFAFMARNATQPTPFYGLPPEQVIRFGIEIEL